MYQVELISAPILFTGERKPVLLPELASFTYLGLLAAELRQSINHMFRLHFLKLLEVDVADPLVPQVDVPLNLLSFCKHNTANIIRFEDKHPPVSAPLPNNLAFFLDEAPEMREPDLHPLVDDLPD